MTVRADTKGIAAAVFAAFCWGSATVMSKSALEVVSPVALLAVQLVASTTALWAFVLLAGRPLPERRAGSRITALGLLEPGGAYLLGLIGLVWIGAGVATLLQATEAIMIVALAALLLRERPSARIVLLSLVALGGLAVALDVTGLEAGGNAPLGILMILLATGTAAVYVVTSARMAGDHDPWVMVGLQQLSALVLALLALPIEQVVRTGGIALPHDGQGWAVAVLSGLVQYALAFSAYMYALSRIPAGLAGSVLILTPVFGIGAAAVFLGETLTATQIAGTVVTLAAVAAIQIDGRNAAAG